jgi:hypothetical protein
MRIGELIVVADIAADLGRGSMLVLSVILHFCGLIFLHIFPFYVIQNKQEMYAQLSSVLLELSRSMNQ